MTTEPKHTPGPWIVGYTSKDAPGYARFCRIQKDDDSNARVAQVFAASGDGEERDATAHLIASVTDLLEALQQIAKGEGRFSRDPLEHASSTIEDMKAIAEAAIAKATGQGETGKKGNMNR